MLQIYDSFAEIKAYIFRESNSIKRKISDIIIITFNHLFSRLSINTIPIIIIIGDSFLNCLLYPIRS